MQFFDLNRQIHLSDILTPSKTLSDLANQNWFLSKVRIDHDCETDSEQIEGQVILKSNENIQLELEWVIQDTGFELQVLFKGIEIETCTATFVTVKGARLVDENQHELKAQALSLWIDATILNMIPNLRKEVKARLNLWDYVGYDG